MYLNFCAILHKVSSTINFVFACREREALAAENEARYQALKMRWKDLMQTFRPPVEPDLPESIPLYLRECQSHNNHDQANDERNQLSVAAAEQDVSQVGEDQLVFLNLTAKVSSLINIVGGGQGGLNLPLPVPFNPGSRPVFFGSRPFAFIPLRNIAQCCVIFSLFLPLPATLGIPLPPPLLPSPVHLPPPFLPVSRPPVPPHNIMFDHHWPGCTYFLWCEAIGSIIIPRILPCVSY